MSNINTNQTTKMCLPARAFAFLAPLMLLGVLGSSQAVAAIKVSSSSQRISPSAALQKTKCSNQTSKIKYTGGYPYNGVFPDRPASGEVVVCYRKWRFVDDDPRYDYYALEAESSWTYKSGKRNFPARMYQFIASNKTSQQNVYSSTPTFTSSTSCGREFEVSFAVGPIEIGTSQQVCNSYTVTRSAYTANRSNWTSSKAGGLKMVTTVYYQKVPAGAAPKFDVNFAIPQYKNYWNNLYWETREDFYWVDFRGV